jgi:DNA polymerase III subunit delta
MQIRAEQLEAHFANALARSGGSLAPVYLVHGDEPLLALEAANHVRAAARKHGFTEREVFEPSRYFDWSEFAHAAGSLSLFGDKKLIELRLPTGKPAAPAAKALVEYCARPGADMILLVTMPRPEGSGWWKSEWFSALEAAGAVVEIQPVARAQLPAWLALRLAKQKQSAPREVLEFLADRVEGNLLAAHQEVQKLALLAPEGELAMESVDEAVASVARYDPHAAVEALLRQDTLRYVRIIEGLRGEGEQPTFVLFVLAGALFVLQGAQRGGQVDSLALQHKLFNKPLKAAVQAAASRGKGGFPGAALDAALSHAALIDRAIKGVHPGDPWQEFIKLGLKLARGSKG